MSAVDLSPTGDPRVTVHAVNMIMQLTQAMDKLVERMEQLQLKWLVWDSHQCWVSWKWDCVEDSGGKFVENAKTAVGGSTWLVTVLCLLRTEHRVVTTTRSKTLCEC